MNTPSSFRFILSFLAVAAGLLLETAGAFGGPLVIRQVLDSQGADLLLGAGALIALALAQAGGAFLTESQAAQASERLAYDLRVRTYRHIQSFSFEELGRWGSGDLVQRGTGDIETWRRFWAYDLPQVLRTLILILWIVPLLFSLDAGLAPWALVAVPLILGFSALTYRQVEGAFQAMDEAEGGLTGRLQESLNGVRTIKAFARQAFEFGRFTEANEHYRRKTWVFVAWLALYWGFTATVAIGQSALILSLGTVRLVEGSLSVGTLVAFLALVIQLMFPLRLFGRILGNLGKARVARRRLEEVLARPSEGASETPAGPGLTSAPVVPLAAPVGTEAPLVALAPAEGPAAEGPATAEPGTWVFEDVHFSYPGGPEILKGISFTLRPGETLALLGPTGAGKSTLCLLLGRYYDVTGGRITRNGVDLRQLDRAWLRAQVTVLLQEPFLFARSLKANLSLARPGAPDEDLKAAAHAAHFHEVAQSFRDRWDTLVGERGVTLSGGQKQRLVLARALLRDNPVLVLDDSLSAVDTETDARVRAALKARRGQTSTLLVAHRLTTLAEADRILVLEDGRLSAEGTHEELCAQPGLYQRLWRLQNELAVEEAAAHE